VALFDLTWEVGMPVVLAEVALPDLPFVWRGSGCHPSRDVALSRALTEAAQSRLTYIAERATTSSCSPARRRSATRRPAS
jgi:ribosomal protein S12 methylthiotransferase accessory factor